jgi:hypothetical protein
MIALLLLSALCMYATTNAEKKMIGKMMGLRSLGRTPMKSKGIAASLIALIALETSFFAFEVETLVIL